MIADRVAGEFLAMETKIFFSGVKPSKFSLAQRRAGYYDVADIITSAQYKIQDDEIKALEDIDLIYRTITAILYNFATTSGHPGGSISSGRIAQGLLFTSMDYDFFNPQRESNDIITYAAGHKAMGLYALWALRNELLRASGAGEMPAEKFQLRFEDLLGFRRNPVTDTPLFRKFHSKALDGHPTPHTPFIKTATGASGIGVGAGVGLALGAMDAYADKAPKVHMIEGEGGLTPGRVSEAMAAAATAQLSNAIIHIDWNQASIDSNNVCPENSRPGDYVQWAPAELAYLNDWNVVYVSNGHDFFQILTAQKFAVKQSENKQPTAVVYRTIKGWKYGIEGRSAHGAGHKFSSDGYYSTLGEFEGKFSAKMPRYCASLPTPAAVEECFYDTLMVIRKAIEANPALSRFALDMITASRERLEAQDRVPRAGVPDPQKAYSVKGAQPPDELNFKPGTEITLREALARALKHLNHLTGGAILVSSADLYSSTSVNLAGEGFGAGFFNSVSNPRSRIISAGGICEDAMGAIASGISSFGRHIGVTSSYAAFIAPLEHIAARLHAIGQQNRKALDGLPYSPFIMVNAHAGVKTGEDGPTHADPQPLQLLEGNFPKGALITLTPWEPGEVWPLLASALNQRPAVIAPFVTRPVEKVVDRAALGLPPAAEAAKGVYYFLKSNPRKPHHGTVVLQGNAVATIFAHEVLPKIKEAGLNMNVLYISSKELFELLDPEEKEKLFPEKLAMEAMGMTDFTLPTMYYWVRSRDGIARTLHSFRNGGYPGSGKAADVLKEAGLDAGAQFTAVKDYAASMAVAQKQRR
jgi:transketolase